MASKLLAGFNAMVGEVSRELALRGHPGVTATLEFALQAVNNGADDASSLGRELGVSKQAAAQTIATLERLGYSERAADPADRRRKNVRVTPRGFEMIALGAAVFDQIRDRIGAEQGPQRLAAFESVLAALASRSE